MKRFAIIIDDNRDCIVAVDTMFMRVERLTMFGENTIKLNSYEYVPDYDANCFYLVDEDTGTNIVVPVNSFHLPYDHIDESTIFYTDDPYAERCKIVLSPELAEYMINKTEDESDLYSEVRGVEMMYMKYKALK